MYNSYGQQQSQQNPSYQRTDAGGAGAGGGGGGGGHQVFPNLNTAYPQLHHLQQQSPTNHHRQLQHHPDDESPSPVTSNKSPGKAVGGRPLDKVWDFFEGDRQLAKCQRCDWKTDHPKAFRMRAHVQACSAIPDDLKRELEEYQNAKPPRKARQEEAEEGADPGPSVPKKVKKEKQPQPKPKPQPQQQQPHAVHKTPLKSPITCHVLDSTSGKPAPGMRIRLDRLNANGFVLLSSGTTDDDGRCSTLLQPGSKVDVGIFKITFFSSEYFTKRGITSFYPFIEIPFEVKDQEHYHIPLLLSPYSFTSYRGS